MKRFLLAAALLALPGAIASAFAGVVIEGTRVVYPGREREVTVKMTNKGDGPVLMQVWADRGDAHSQPQTADAPFLITPPIFRLDAGKGQSVRVVFAGEDVPADRESLFWFNSLEVPAMPADTDRNYMQIALRSRLKLFYRPAGLRGDLPAAVEGVVWQVRPTAQGYALHGENPSPYHVTFTKLLVIQDGQRYDAQSGMIDPLSSRDFPLTGFPGKRAGARVSYGWMSDYGPGPRAEAALQ